MLTCVILCVPAFFACGCREQRELEVHKNRFSCKADAEYNGIALTCSLEIGENGTASARIEKPESLTGLTCSCDGESITVSYLGIKKEFDMEENSYFGCFSEIRKILLSIPDGLKLTVGSDRAVYEGECDMGSYRVSFNSEGFPSEIELPSLGLTVRLYDFKQSR